MDTIPGLNTRTGATALVMACLAVSSPAAPAHADGEGQHPAAHPAVGGPLLGRPGVHVRPKHGGPLPPELSAVSWMVTDARTGEVLAAKEAHRPLPPASTLKTLFAVTVLPRLPQTSLRKVREADLAGMGAGSSQVGVQPGKRYTVADLWRGVFLSSGNDAVHALAAMNGSLSGTVAQMRLRARELGAYDTRVVSPDGYDAPGQVSSAYDLSLFVLAGLSNRDFVRYSSTGVATFPKGRRANGTADGAYQIQNTNRLLVGAPGLAPYRGLIGVKNGYTSQAGNTLVVAARRGGRTLVATVMNPRSGLPNAVYHEARSLLDWGFAAAGKVSAVGLIQRPRSVTAARPAVRPPRPKKAVTPSPGTVSRLAGAVPHSGAAAVLLAGGLGALALCGTALVVRRRRRPWGRGRTL